MSDHRLISQALTAIEHRERRLLAWGLTDGGLTDAELDETLRSVEGIDPELARDELVLRRVLAQYPTRTTPLWRSRAAETMRLLVSLRQWMHRPPEVLLDTWRDAPPLIADYRFFLDDKLRPRRDVPATAVDHALRNENVELSGVQREAVTRLLGLDRADPMNFAGFQMRAAVRVLRDLASEANRGSVICAGTGTGKTFAFYFPALTYLAGMIDADEWTRALLIYPRNELLKDQFATTYAMCRRLDGLFGRGRKVTIGAFYGETPGRLFGRTGAERMRNLPRAWERRNGGAICPYLRCPNCGGPLLWSCEDLEDERERLRCLTCSRTLEPDQIRLTRGSLQDHPPDLLFTNMDQINRRLCDFHFGRSIGVGASRAPRVVLLDEAHTYEGRAGAQAAATLRRWRHAVAGRASVTFVGLSATLASADSFFADLTGLRQSDVAAIEPRQDELESLGSEYHVALRHDAAGGAQLLGVTIQSAMLMRRALDPGRDRPSGGLLGSQVFCFTDTLDVVNRLEHQLSDAEQNRRLAALRWVDEQADYHRERHHENRLAGQAWDMPRSLGHRFAPSDSGAQVGRVSSQDPGLAENADIIVATASLEVGYDSDTVGAVIQHKSPRSGASFLQRMGRAGRPGPMRPWKIIVLSDFGRDRDGFQQVENLFHPEIVARSLPRSNRYVLRMQAAMAVLDWLAMRLRNDGCDSVSVWQMCSTPFAGKGGFQQAQLKNQARAVRLLEDLLVDDPKYRDRLAAYLSRALREPRETVDCLLWDPPRSILRALVPTLLRRLTTGWAFEGQRVEFNEDGTVRGSSEPFEFDHPIPEFVPRFLSSDLVLPEVRLGIGDNALDTDGVELVLSTFAPGNVTMRYGPRDADHAHWLPPGALTLDAMRVGGQVLPGRRLKSRPANPIAPATEVTIDVVRPHWLRVERTPDSVSRSSKCAPVWASSIEPIGPGESLQTPEGIAWTEILRGATFYTHGGGSGVEVLRAVTGAHGQVRRGRGDAQSVNGCFRKDDKPVALGFEYQADAVRFRCRIPADLERVVQADPTISKRLRVDAFRSRLEHDAMMPENLNVFQRRHAADVFVAASVAWAEARGLSLEAAIEQIRTGLTPLQDILQRAAHALLRSSLAGDVAEPDDDNGDPGHPDDYNGLSRRAQELLDAIRNDAVADAILRNTTALVEPIEGPLWKPLLRARFAETIGAALLDAARRVEPGADSDTLSVDSLWTDEPDTVDLWLTERAAGGTGVIEGFFNAYTADPHRFFQLFGVALEPSGVERVSENFERLLELLARDAELMGALRAARDASGVSEGETSLRTLFDTCAQRGIVPNHRFRVMAVSRLVQQPTADLDSLIELSNTLLTQWDDVESRHQVEVDPRVVAYLASQDERCINLLSHSVGDGARSDDDAWIHSRLSGLLWRRGGALRQAALEVWQRFTPAFGVDRLLVTATVRFQRAEISMESDGWLDRLGALLAEYAEVTIIMPDATPGAGRELGVLLGTLFDSGFLRLPVSIDRIDRIANAHRIMVRLTGGLR